MRVAVTGATGFVGRYIVAELTGDGNDVRCWRRPESDCGGFDPSAPIEWLEGRLGDETSTQQLVAGCQAVVHAALFHPGGGFRGGEGDILPFAQTNIMGTLQLIEAARAAGVERFIFISTCAVYEKILDDRPLDEAHPLWPANHYGAHKAALEAFVHSYGWGRGFPICALRPTGVYGRARPTSKSKWFNLVKQVLQGETVHCRQGGKEVHAADVARAINLLLQQPVEKVAGEAFNCYDRYISDWDVAQLAQRLSGSECALAGGQTAPKHQIESGKLTALGMRFGGQELLERTIQQMIDAAGNP